ncbi:MAG: cell division site-positioning protein MapZ family protein, partial [Vagococcus sp.]
MTKELNKCPNCGHQFKDGEEYCPNCDLFIPVSDQTDADNTFDPNQTKQFKTFKEIETTKNETEQPTESLFKHRNIKADSIDESEEKPVSQPETTIEEVPSEPVVETPSEKEDITTSEKTPDTEMVEDKELSVESEETIDLDATVPLDFDEEDLANEPIPSTQTIEPTTPKEDDIEGSVSKPLETSISSRQTTNEPKKKTTRNAVIGLSAAALLAIGGFTVYSSQQKKAVEKDRVALVDTTKNAIDSLFSSKDQVFLKDDLSKADFDLASKDLEKLKGKEGYDQLKESYDEAEAKFNKQQGLNDLFKSPII